MSIFTIETDRLILKPLTLSDSKALYAIFSDREVMKYWNTEAWISEEQAISFILQSEKEMKNMSSVILGLYLKDSSSLIGKIMLFNVCSESKRAEIGFGISREHWKKGLVSEASKAFVTFAFNELKLRRLEAEIDPKNLASASTLDKIGFIKEGHLRQRWSINGVISDSALYGILR